MIVHDDGLDAPGTLRQFASVADLLARREAGAALAAAAGPPAIAQVVAYDAGFAALSRAPGQVWTWGDARYPACLGRDVDDER